MRKKWAELTEKEINEIKRKQCLNCKWFSRGTGGYKGASTCDYGAEHSHSRGCDPRDCVSEGIFVPLENISKRRKAAWKSIVKH